MTGQGLPYELELLGRAYYEYLNTRKDCPKCKNNTMKNTGTCIYGWESFRCTNCKIAMWLDEYNN